LELRPGIGHLAGIDVFEEDEDLRGAGLPPALHRPVKLFLGATTKTSERSMSWLITPCARRPVVASVSSQPSAANLIPAPSPKPPFSSSITSLNARRSTARSPGDAMKTWINLGSGRGEPIGCIPLLVAS
jgi:hypothetical protein